MRAARSGDLARSASVDPLSTTITSPGAPERRIPSNAWSTTLPTASSSFRHGMITEICGTAPSLVRS